MNARGGIADDGGDLILDDDVRITDNLTVEGILFNYSTGTKIYVNESGCIIIQAGTTIDATCP